MNPYFSRARRILLTAAASLLLTGCSGSDNVLGPSAGTVTVLQSGAGDFTSIQAAIDGSPAGALIQVGAGTFDGIVLSGVLAGEKGSPQPPPI